MKKLIALAMAAAMVLGMTACSPKEAEPEKSGTATSGAVSQSEGGTPAELTEAFAEGPVLLSTAGQSADVEMVKVLLEKAGIEAIMDNAADGSDLSGAKTLILAVGGSSKGLGAAGTDADSEIARVEALAQAADEAGMSIIAVHVGGTARRGDLSDKFMAPGFALADYAVVVEAGDQDGAMAALAAEHGIPLAYADSMANVVEPLKAAFK